MGVANSGANMIQIIRASPGQNVKRVLAAFILST